MGAVKFVKALALVALFNGALYLCVREEAIAGEREEEAKKYTEQLRKGKDAKAKVTALQELGRLAQIKKSLVADALPDIYKAVQDKEAGVRATLDARDTLSARIRDAEVHKVPYMAVIGEREAEAGTAAIRRRGGGRKQEIMDREAFVAQVAREIETRAREEEG